MIDSSSSEDERSDASITMQEKTNSSQSENVCEKSTVIFKLYFDLGCMQIHIAGRNKVDTFKNSKIAYFM